MERKKESVLTSSSLKEVKICKIIIRFHAKHQTQASVRGSITNYSSKKKLQIFLQEYMFIPQKVTWRFFG